MKLLHAAILLAAALPASANDDPVARCRAAHAVDPIAHIGCLEAALRAGAAPGATSATTAAAMTTATPPAASLGLEQAEARQRAAEPAAAAAAAKTVVRIVEVRYNSAGLGVFRMVDGQAWQETVVTPARLHLRPGKEYDAVIERGALGGYRMHVDGVRWLHKVERLK